MFTKSDLITVRERLNKAVYYSISPQEIREVISRVNEVAFFLYNYYRTAYLTEANDVSDEVVGELIGWPIRKVSKYRVELHKAGLIRLYKDGSITKLIVGLDRVALADAGLPDNIHNQSSFKKIKKQLGISTTEELINSVEAIQHQYTMNQTGTNNDS